MDAAVITALSTIFGAIVSGIVALIVASKQHDAAMAEVDKKHDEQIALIEYRLKQLEEKQDKHNNLIERMYILETKVNMYHKGA